MPSAPAKSLAVPIGMTPIRTSSPLAFMLFTTKFTVPSPPAATSRSISSRPSNGLTAKSMATASMR